MNFLLVFIGGGIGSVLRFGLSLLFSSQKINGIFATLSANIISCIVIAFVVAETLNQKQSNNQIFWAVGFCGGLSTFSTFSMQNWQLLQNQQWGLLCFNVLSNLLLTIAAIWIGLKMNAAMA